MDAIAQLSFEVVGRLTQLAAEEDMSLTQLRMFAVLRDRRPRMAELAGVLGLDRSSITGLIGRAERRGLLQRTTVENDGRGVRVELTEAGRAFTDRTADKVAERLEDLLDPLDAATRVELQRAVTRMLPGR